MIETNISEVIGQLRRDFQNVLRIRDDAVPTFADRAVQLEEEEAPKRSGYLASSVEAIGDKNETFVRPTADHAKYVISGTRESPGRYVPAIGKRLVNPKRNIGTHSGMKANPFVERAFERLLGESQQILERLVRSLH